MQCARDAKFGQVVGLNVLQFLAIKSDAAFIGREEATHYVKHRGLAGTIGADQAGNRAFRYADTHVVENLESTQRDADVFNGKQWMRQR